MKDLEQLKQQILAEVEEASQQELAVATKKQEERTNAANASLASQEVAKKTALKQRAKASWDKERQSLLNQSKKEILQVKRDLLNSVFDDVYTLMTQWRGETLVTFIQSAASGLDTSSPVTLILADGTVDHLSASDRAALEESLTISPEVISHQEGFILRQGGIDYNYCYDALIADLRQEYSPELARNAFNA